MQGDPPPLMQSAATHPTPFVVGGNTAEATWYFVNHDRFETSPTPRKDYLQRVAALSRKRGKR